MLTATLAHDRAPPLLQPELAGLVDAGILARAAARDAGERARVALPPCGALTAAQGGALAALLGVDVPTANDHG